MGDVIILFGVVIGLVKRNFDVLLEIFFDFVIEYLKKNECLSNKFWRKIVHRIYKLNDNGTMVHTERIKTKTYLKTTGTHV